MAAAAMGLLLVASGLPGQDGRTTSEPRAGRIGDGSTGCLRCHEGIEEMHPAAQLSCVDCHGGDETALQKLEAHVLRVSSDPGDERVADRHEGLDRLQFENPMDLRVVHRTCGSCHGELVKHLEIGLHGTTAGHLSDGYYEVGLHDEKGSRYGVFPVPEHAAEEGEVDRLTRVPPFADHLPEQSLARHYSDLPRKECMQCHLWSEGRAVRGRVGFDGDYRGAGCAACHVEYSLGGTTESRDRSAVRNEPGHPRRHAMTRAPSTRTCTSCHYGDASIGLSFRGLSQLPPGAPGGPEVPGTTDSPLNRAFYLDDPSVCPPDVHHERGMHCIDCHTLGDVMGDGALHGQMEHAVEISCQACHGTFTRASQLVTERGTPLAHLRRAGERVVLTSKVTGAEHDVPQVVHVLDQERPEYNADAAAAMTAAHEGVECYTCHAAWNVNFLGFHFYRNETLTQLDLLSGRRTPGRVTTQEKVFATWKSFYAGLNEAGRVAPYMTGFSTMGSVTDAKGERILDQVLPETAAGLSGLTMVHHQTHTVRPTARECVECHRSPATWGLGSENFRLARQLAFVADRRGIEVLALDRTQLASSVPLAKVVLPDVVDMALLSEPVQGEAQYVYASEGYRGVHVIDVRDPTHPKRVGFVATVAPRGLQVAGEHLYVADGQAGLRIFSLARPEAPELVAMVPTFDAHEVRVQWPWAYVADGPGGLAIVDVRAPIAPRVVAQVALFPRSAVADMAIDLSLLFQYGRPLANDDGRVLDRREPARNLCAVVDEVQGLVMLDVTEPRAVVRLYPRRDGRTAARENVLYRGVRLLSHVDLAELQGGSRTRERDYVYMIQERILNNGESRSAVAILDVDRPEAARRVGAVAAGEATEMLGLTSFYNPPFLQTVAFSPGELGLEITDVSVSARPTSLGRVAALPIAYAVAVEEFPLDRMRDASGRALKDVSHPGSRWMYLSEVERVLDVSAEELGTLEPGEEDAPLLGHTARLVLERLDVDRSGFLEGDEAKGALASSADRDEDGRVSLLELAELGGVFAARGTEVAAGDGGAFAAGRVDPDGDLARLLDGVDPYSFDRDDDLVLQRSEMEAALFAALDLDGDRWLTRAELSRHPGPLRQLRYGDRAAERLFAKEDRTSDGKVSAREFGLKDAEWRALDADASGGVALPTDVSWLDVRRGFVPEEPEWPRRRAEPLPLPPLLRLEALLASLDADGDGTLTGRELRARKDLLRRLDRDDSGFLDEAELDRAVGSVARGGVEVVEDGFERRWDLDGDGRVEPDELPIPAWLRERILGRPGRR